MAQNQQLGTFGQVVSVNTVANTVTITSQIAVGNVSINSTGISIGGGSLNNVNYPGTANNANNLGGVAAVSYVNTAGSYTITGIHTYDANVVIGTSAGISANGSFGSAGQSLLSNGSGVYWATAGATLNANNTDTTTYYIGLSSGTSGSWTNAVVATSGLSFVPSTGTLTVSNTIVGATFTGTANVATYLGNSSATVANVSSWITSNASAAYSNSVTYTDISIGTANAAITGNAFTAFNNAASYADTKSGTAYSNAVSYIDTKIGTANAAITGNAATSYSNATSYTDSRIIDSVVNTSTSYAASANSVKNAYDRAIDANTRAASAQTAASSAYSNAVTYTDTKIATANAAITGNAATAYSNAVTYTDTKIGTANAAITGNAATAYSNAVSYVDGKSFVNTSQLSSNLSNYATLSGVTFTGNVAMSSQYITGLGNPVNAQDAATKYYVDLMAQGLHAAPSAKVFSNSNLSATYVNGNSGVGATLTSTANGAFPTIDGVTISSNTLGQNGILVAGQSNSVQNGRYNLTTVGNTTTPWVLTRCMYCDQSSEIPGSYVFITDGTLYADTGWVATVTDTATFSVGTDAIIYRQFSGAGSFTAGNYLYLIGTQFNVNAASAATGGVVVARDSNGSFSANVITGSSFTGTANNSTFAYGKSEGNLNVNNATTAYGKSEGNLNVNNALTSNNSTNLGGQAAAYYTNASNMSSGTLPDARLTAAVTNTSGAFTISGTRTFNANVTFGTSAGLIANGSVGTAGQVLTSNATTVYWASPAATGVTSITGGTGLSGGTITSTGTLSVNASYIATISSNNASFLGGVAAASYLTTASASSTYAPLASPTFTGTVSVAQANVLNQTLTDAATIAWNTSSGQVATVTLGASRTMGAPSNLKVGTYILHVIQGGSGSYGITWNSVFKWPAGVAPVLSTAVGARDVFSFISDGTNLYGSYLTDVK